MNCAMAIERMYRGEEGVFVGIFRAPEQQPLSQLQEAVAWYKNETLEKVGFYRMALRFSKAPTPLRRLMWWGALNMSGFKRSKRFGIFGLSSYEALGRAEQIHPISPLTTTLTYGPIDPTHRESDRQTLPTTTESWTVFLSRVGVRRRRGVGTAQFWMSYEADRRGRKHRRPPRDHLRTHLTAC